MDVDVPHGLEGLMMEGELEGLRGVMEHEGAGLLLQGGILLALSQRLMHVSLVEPGAWGHFSLFHS